jgi:ABC-type multidrug transport system ATPase subunit
MSQKSCDKEISCIEKIDFLFKKNPSLPIRLSGPSGCGKTTSMQLYALQFQLRNLGAISYSEQHPTFFNETVDKNTDVFLLPGEHIKFRMLISRFNLTHLIDDESYDAESYLSAGERMRLSVAIAIATDASLYCFDEPTTGLDKDSHNYIWGEIGLLSARRKVIFISHDDVNIKHQTLCIEAP